AVAVAASVGESEARARRLLRETETLVAADQRPAADLDQLRADVADKAGRRVRADRDVSAARLALGEAMGLGASAAAALPMPGDAFPGASGTGTAADLAAAAMVELALSRRG